MAITETVEEMLGLRPPTGQPATFLPNIVAQGLPLASVDKVVRRIAPGDASLRFKIIAKATWARRRKSDHGKLNAEESDKLVRLLKVFTLALDIYKDPVTAREFLGRRHPMLDDQAPLDLALASGAGADAATSLLMRLAYGGGV